MLAMGVFKVSVLLTILALAESLSFNDLVLKRIFERTKSSDEILRKIIGKPKSDDPCDAPNDSILRTQHNCVSIDEAIEAGFSVLPDQGETAIPMPPEGSAFNNPAWMATNPMLHPELDNSNVGHSDGQSQEQTDGSQKKGDGEKIKFLLTAEHMFDGDRSELNEKELRKIAEFNKARGILMSRRNAGGELPPVEENDVEANDLPLQQLVGDVEQQFQQLVPKPKDAKFLKDLQSSIRKKRKRNDKNWKEGEAERVARW